MKAKKTIVAALCVLMLSGILMTAAFAWTGSNPNLPPGEVTLTNKNLTPYDYPFDSALSNVPPGFDVMNSPPDYTGWCVDLVGGAVRGSAYQVTLLSSLSGSLPAPFDTIDWHRINYVLNHKQGTGVDISQAIWYFVNGNAFPNSGQLPQYPFQLPPTTLAQDMVDDAIANGASFVPGPGQIVAVICNPTTEATQDTIIELTVPTLGPGLTPGFWKHNIGIFLGIRNGAYSNSGSSIVNAVGMEAWLGSLGFSEAELLDFYNALNTQGGGAAGAALRQGTANIFNALAGLSTTVIV